MPSRNALVFKYFAQQESYPRKHLVKLTYEADLLARQFLGHPISEFTYILHNMGPYPVETTETIQELTDLGLAWPEKGARADQYDWATKKLFNVGRPVLFDFSDEENEILAYVVRSFGNIPTDELVEIVYDSAPVKRVLDQRTESHHPPLPMDEENGSRRNEVPFSLAKVLRAERQATEGNAMSAKEYLDGLERRFAARYAN